MKLFLLVTSLLFGCGDMHEVGGKTAKEVFGEGRLADLAIAACAGQADTVAQIASQGANVNGTGFQGTTPLMWALTCENIVGMKALLLAGAEPNKYIDGSVNSIVLAATYDKSDLLKLLLESGGDANSTDRRVDRPALDLAFLKGIEDQDWTNFDLLLAAGANLARVDRTGSTSVEYFAKLNRFDIVNRMLEEQEYRHNLKKLKLLAETAKIDPESHLAVERAKCLELLKNIEKQ